MLWLQVLLFVSCTAKIYIFQSLLSPAKQDDIYIYIYIIYIGSAVSFRGNPLILQTQDELGAYL